MVLGALSPGVKRPRREADHSSPTSAEVKKTWVNSPIRLHVVVQEQLYLLQAVKAHRVVRRRGSHTFQTIGSHMAVRLSALRADHILSG
jgi:hypothetical protein